MDDLQAFALGFSNRDKEPKVFDWLKAVGLINEHKAQSASAGLAEDWEATHDLILQDGLPMKRENTYAYLASTWATPVLKIGDETFDCYKMQSEVPEWNAHTHWPSEAMNAKEKQDGIRS